MTSKAEKLLDAMRESQSNWKRKDLETLYSGVGFIIRHGANHDIVSHPDFPHLRDTLQRHRKVPKYNIRNADSELETDETSDNDE